MLDLSRAFSRSHASVKQCWLEVVPQACSELRPADTPAAALAIAATVAEVLEMYSDGSTSSAMISAVAGIARMEAIGGAFASALVARLLAATSGSKPAVASTTGRTLALCALCAALRGQFSMLAGPADAPCDGFSDLVIAQGGLLHAIREAGRRPALERAACAAEFQS